MKILILGGDGMLGHQLFLSLRKTHEVRVTLHQDLNAYKQFNLFTTENSFSRINVCQTDNLLSILSCFQPDVVINAIGIVKQREAAKETMLSLDVNAVFPHRLSQLCKIAGARLIHMSTDCVFSGRKGSYTENDLSDAEDLYGKSKSLGELHDTHCLTIRSSIIGLELLRKTGLIEWFLAQNGRIKGYHRAIFTGLTTQEMSRVIERVIVRHPEIFGVWHVSSETPITKFELLNVFSKMLNRQNIEIDLDENYVCDRSLLSERFKKATSYQPPSWQVMLSELSAQVKLREKELCY
jgi:dTDP-4-dehydrorhamnose reductase